MGTPHFTQQVTQNSGFPHSGGEWEELSQGDHQSNMKSNMVLALWQHSLHPSLQSQFMSQYTAVHLLLSLGFFHFPFFTGRFLTHYLEKWDLSDVNEERCLHSVLCKLTPCSQVFLGDSNSPWTLLHKQHKYWTSHVRAVVPYLWLDSISCSGALGHWLMSCYLTSSRAMLRWH